MKISLIIKNRDLYKSSSIEQLGLDLSCNGLSGNCYLQGKELHIDIEDLKKLDTVLYFLNKVAKKSLKLNK